jgi:hypothetical protein
MQQRIYRRRRRRPASRLRNGRRMWRRLAPLVLGLLLLLLAPMLANAQGGGADSVRMVWTAPGDDGAIGTATGYEMRISTSPIDAGNWSAATVVTGLPAPLPNGTRQGVTIRGLSNGTPYYVAMRSVDDAGNWSAISNVVLCDWVLDAAPPAAPSGVSATFPSPNVRVTWSANSEPDLDGYSVYRATSALGSYTRLNAALTSATQYLDTSLPGGATSLWYKVSASDLSGNESALSSAFRIDLTAGAAPADWTVSPAFPNPSTSAQSVCIPIAVPASGAGDAVVDVLDSAGQRVRHLPLLGSTSCAGGGVVWDGRNDSGRLVAPGVYRAWLIAGDTRNMIKLVRQP